MKTTVSGCRIEASRWGINWINNDGSRNMIASSNQIFMSGNKLGVAINMEEVNGGNNANYSINNNFQIDITSAWAGIATTRVNNALILNNYIIQNSNINTPTSHGILINGGARLDVECNTVECTDPNYDLSWGLHTSISTDNTFECNEFLANGTGIYFGGPCGGTALIANEMHDNDLGLYMDNSAVIGRQPGGIGTPAPPWHGNRWTGTFSSGYGAVNMNANFPIDLQQNLFTTNQTLLSHNPVIPDGNQSDFNGVNNNGWFNPQIYGSSLGCSQVCIPQFAGGGGDYELSMRIAQDSAISAEYIPETKAMAKQYLYEKLNEDSILLNSDTLFLVFVSNNQNAVIGHLYSAKSQIDQLGEMDSTVQNGLLITDSLIQMYIDSIFFLDSLMMLNPLPAYILQKQALKTQLNYQQLNRRTLVVQIHSQDSLKLNNASVENNLAVPLDLPHLNEKAANENLYKYYTYGKDSLASHFTELLGIAHQCPFAGGTAVYLARILVGLFNDTIEYNDADVCLQQGYFRTQIKADETEPMTEIEIIPNPANKTVEIKLNSDATGICKFKLMDVIGNTVFDGDFNCADKSYHLNVSHFVPGIYQVEILINSNLVKNAKLAIVR